MASKASTNNKPNPALKRTATPPLSFALDWRLQCGGVSKGG